MKKVLLLIIAICLFAVIHAQQNEFLRTYSLPGTREDANAMIKTLDGNFITAGFLTVSGANKDLLVVKLDSVGDIIWSETYGGSNHEVGLDICQPDSNSFIITGYTTSYGAGSYDVYIIKINNDGGLIWEKTFGDVGIDEGHSVICTSDKNLLVVGEKNIASVTQLCMFKLDTAGNLIWEKDFGGVLTDLGSSVLETYNGYVVVGETESFRSSGIGSDVYLLKTDTAGNELWHKNFGGTFHDYGADLLILEDSSIIIAGNYTQGGVTNFDVFVIKTDSLGNQIWDSKIGGTQNRDQLAFSIIQTFDDNFVIAGYSYPDAVSNDIYLLKINQVGGKIWDRHYGDDIYEAARAIIEDSDTNLVTTGIIQPDLYLSKMNREGCFYYKPLLNADTVICDSVPNIITVGVYADYQWSNGEITSQISVLTPNTYWVRVEDDNTCPYFSDSISLIDGTPWFNLDLSKSDSICYGDTTVLSANLVSIDTAYTYTYSWLSSDTTQSINALSSGNYSVNVTNSTLACGHVESQKIYVDLPKEQEIFMVTNDSLGNNMVVWEKTPDEAIVSYQIYSTTIKDNNYQLLETVSADSVAVVVDNSTDNFEFYSYYITTIDTCGNEFVGNYHNTLQLEFDSLNHSNHSASFLIKPYKVENDTIEILSYYLYRGVSADNLEIYDTINRNSKSFTDWDVLSYTDTLYYQLMAVTKYTCNLNANIINSDTLYTDTLFNKIYSNIHPNWNEPVVSIGDQETIPQMKIFPNPFSGTTTIQFYNPKMSMYSLNMYDISGKVVKRISNIMSSEVHLDCSDISLGYYFIELRGDNVFKGAIIVK